MPFFEKVFFHYFCFKVLANIIGIKDEQKSNGQREFVNEDTIPNGIVNYSSANSYLQNQGIKIRYRRCYFIIRVGIFCHFFINLQ